MSFKKVFILLAVLPISLYGFVALAYNWHSNMERARDDYAQLLMQATRRQRLRVEHYLTTAIDGLHIGNNTLGGDLDHEDLNHLTLDKIDEYLKHLLKRHFRISMTCIAFVDGWNDVGGKRNFSSGCKTRPGIGAGDSDRFD